MKESWNFIRFYARFRLNVFFFSIFPGFHHHHRQMNLFKFRWVKYLHVLLLLFHPSSDASSESCMPFRIRLYYKIFSIPKGWWWWCSSCVNWTQIDNIFSWQFYYTIQEWNVNFHNDDEIPQNSLMRACIRVCKFFIFSLNNFFLFWLKNKEGNDDDAFALGDDGIAHSSSSS